jgi:hypothetical protein
VAPLRKGAANTGGGGGADSQGGSGIVVVQEVAGSSPGIWNTAALRYLAGNETLE